MNVNRLTVIDVSWKVNFWLKMTRFFQKKNQKKIKIKKIRNGENMFMLIVCQNKTKRGKMKKNKSCF